MLRFIDLGHQIGLDETWPRQFAFLTTVTDTFIECNGYQAFHSWNQFAAHWQDLHPSEQNVWPLDRFRVLCPGWVFEVKGDPFADDQIENS